MRNTTKILTAAGFAVLGALAIAGPASAQMVNGLNGTNPPGEAPIGTKAGASNSAQNAPGAGPAVAGAMQNTMDAKAGQTTTGKKRHHHMVSPDAGN